MYVYLMTNIARLILLSIIVYAGYYIPSVMDRDGISFISALFLYIDDIFVLIGQGIYYTAFVPGKLILFGIYEPLFNAAQESKASAALILVGLMWPLFATLAIIVALYGFVNFFFFPFASAISSKVYEHWRDLYWLYLKMIFIILPVHWPVLWAYSAMEHSRSFARGKYSPHIEPEQEAANQDLADRIIDGIKSK